MRPTDALPHPSDWRTAVVGSAVEIKRGVSWSKDQEHNKPYDGAVPVIGISNVQERLESNKLLWLSGLKPKAIEQKKVKKNWSIMVGSNGNRGRIGNCVLVEQDAEFLFASFLIAAKPNVDSGIVPQFFYRWLRTEEVQSYLSASSEGSTGLSNLSHTFFRKMAIAFPREDEQRAIVGILSAADAAIDNAREAYARAIEVKRALAQELFSRGTRREAQKKSRIGPIPTSWEVMAISAAVRNFEYGLSLPMYLRGETPILRMGNIQHGDVVMDDLKYVTLSHTTLDRYLLKRGDVLFNRTNSQEHVGKIGIYRRDDPAVFASYLIRLHVDPKRIDNYYLGQLLNSYSAQCRIKRYATPGVQQVNINAKNLGKVLIPVPSGNTGLDEQREISCILENADLRSRCYLPVIAALEQLKRSLAHDLLTGTVRVDPASLEKEARG
ncbi:restriction endonuclease subunit S [Dongia sp.]|uniref:restriction endonuclease subunit S n=1 Tax=Dongia sp. TaxID=1977262 RepID=UPI003751132C